jgi:hypothetical protein
LRNIRASAELGWRVLCNLETKRAPLQNLAPAVGFEPAEPPFIANDLDERAHPRAPRKSTVDSGLNEIISVWGDLPLPLRAAVLAVVRTHRPPSVDGGILQGPIRPEDSKTGSDLSRAAGQTAFRSAGEPDSVQPPVIKSLPYVPSLCVDDKVAGTRATMTPRETLPIRSQRRAKHLRKKHSASSKKTKTRKTK